MHTEHLLSETKKYYNISVFLFYSTVLKATILTNIDNCHNCNSLRELFQKTFWGILKKEKFHLCETWDTCYNLKSQFLNIKMNKPLKLGRKSFTDNIKFTEAKVHLTIWLKIQKKSCLCNIICFRNNLTDYSIYSANKTLYIIWLLKHFIVLILKNISDMDPNEINVLTGVT